MLNQGLNARKKKLPQNEKLQAKSVVTNHQFNKLLKGFYCSDNSPLAGGLGYCSIIIFPFQNIKTNARCNQGGIILRNGIFNFIIALLCRQIKI